MLGASVLSGAYIYRFMGIIPSLLLIAVSITILMLSNNVIMKRIAQHQSKTFRELVMQTAGVKFAKMLDLAVVILAFGSLTNYIIIASRAIQQLIQPHITLNPKILKVITKISIAVFVFPLTLLKNTKQLSKISPYSVGCISLTILTIAGYFLYTLFNKQSICTAQIDNQPLELHNDYRHFSDNPVWLQIIQFTKYIPTMLYIFSLPFALPLVYAEFQLSFQNSQKALTTFQKRLQAATFIGIAMYSLISFAAAIMFGAFTKDNVFDSFKLCGFKFVDFIALTYAVVLILCFSLQLQPPRLAFLQLLKKVDDKNFYIAIGALYCVTTLTFALLSEKIVAIFGLFSSFCGFFLYFLIPILGAEIEQKTKIILISFAFIACGTAFVLNLLDFF